jgi:Putative MetA-pathway of phenol degradation
LKFAWALFALACLVRVSDAQDLRPRAYVITPVGTNALIIGYAFHDGSIYTGTVLPIANASGRYSIPNISYYHAFGFFRHFASFTATLPYLVGTVQGEVGAVNREIYRSGMEDSVFRFSVNLIGGPAMDGRKFAKWKQKTILGTSVEVVPPTGQYYASHLINPGNNRWSFKPELGLSQRWHNWLFDAYTGVWLFTDNTNYLTGIVSEHQNTLAQAPIGSVEAHLSYNFKPRLWASLDGNYWYGGSTTVNDVVRIGTLQANSRIGGTISVPFTKHQSVKFSYSNGPLVRFGGDFQTVSVAWQYAWIGRPK